MNFLKHIFSKKTAYPPVHLSELKTDMHSHLIPGIDDGAKTMEESLQLIRRLYEMGYRKLITTPHIMSDYYKNTPEIILSALEKVKEAIKQEGIEVELEAAAEYYLDQDFTEKIPLQNLLTFGNKYVLFELPFISEPPMLNEAIFALQTNGYRPVLAHVERYTFWYGHPEKYQELVDKGVLLQLNINSLTGYYSPQTKKISKQLIDKGLISFLGSDCHHIHHLDLMQKTLCLPAMHHLMQSGKLKNREL